MHTAPELDRSAFEVVLQTKRAYLRRRADARIVAHLPRLEAIVLKLRALYGVEEMHQTLKSITPSADRIVARVRYRFDALLADTRGIAVQYQLEELLDLEDGPGIAGLRDLPGPRVLHWTVTRFCPRQCTYCYAEPLPGRHAKDSTLPRSDLVRIFEESASLGAQLFVVSGSEPFLRPDLPEIMGDALRFGITPSITTKHPISPSLANRLAAVGMRHISISFDTPSELGSRELIGSSRYPAQVLRSTKNLTEAGIRFSFQAVITRLNASDIDDLGRFAATAGAVVLQLVPFEAVRRPLTGLQNDDMSLQDTSCVQAAADRLAAEFPLLQVEVFKKNAESAGYNCDIGMTKLFFLPDGTVHRCYKLADDSTLRGKNLRTCSVVEAWHDPGFGHIISPPEEAYRGTACGGCGRFSRCHSDGRCLFQSSVNNGSYYGVDRQCSGPH